MMSGRFLAASFVVLFAALPAAAQLALGAINGTINYSGTAPQVVEGWVTYLDLSSSRFVPVVTQKPEPSCPLQDQVRIMGTDQFARNYGTFVAITANTGKANPPACATPVGLIVSNGITVTKKEECGLELYFESGMKAAGI